MRIGNIVRLVFIALAMLLQACVAEAPLSEDAVSNDLPKVYNIKEESLKSSEFKLPLSPDYKWGVSQSWAEHCKECDAKYPPSPGENTFCQSSHTGTYTSYGWDFTLPADADKGKPVLASADGVVKTVYTKPMGDWGHYVIIDHGDNVCTRYAHLLSNSITVVKDEQVCQGLKIGEIGKTGTKSEHLHFQFEKCDTKIPIAQGFGENGNYIPKCLVGAADIKANPLQLTNFEKGSCGWTDVGSGKAPGCPLKATCGNKGKPSFGDQAGFDSRTATAVDYLWRECAINGKNDGKFYPQDVVTRAEGLKIAMELFGFTNCVGKEPYSDVKPSDWFYPYVVCGVKHGIIDTKYSGFNPSGELYFSEASKILVLTAEKAGKIQVKSPKVGHFPKIPYYHWAYSYVETIFYYGGVNFSLPEKDAYAKAKRGEFAVMAAALSPCFCQSMKCADNASCNQENYSCDKVTVSLDPEPGSQIGGSFSSDVYGSSTDVVSSSDVGVATSDAGYDVVSSDPYAGVQWESPVGGYGGKGVLPTTYCTALESESKCEGQAVVFPLTCELENPEPEPMKIGSLTIEIPGFDQKSCQLLTAGKFQFDGMVIPPGAKGKTKAEYKVSCKEKPLNNQLNLNFYHDFKMPVGVKWYMVEGGGSAPLTPQFLDKCKPAACIPNCSNKQCGDNGCGGNCGTCTSGSNCSNGQCATIQTGWVCNPDQGYTMMVNSPGGVVEVLTGGDFKYSKFEVSCDTLPLKFACQELPATLLITPGFPMVLVNATAPSAPNFPAWFPYSGGLVLNPKDKPTQTGIYFLDFTYEDAYPPKVLIKIPN